MIYLFSSSTSSLCRTICTTAACWLSWLACSSLAAPCISRSLRLVRSTRQPLVVHGRDVMTALAEVPVDGHRTPAQVVTSLKLAGFIDVALVQQLRRMCSSCYLFASQTASTTPALTSATAKKPAYEVGAASSLLSLRKSLSSIDCTLLLFINLYFRSCGTVRGYKEDLDHQRVRFRRRSGSHHSKNLLHERFICVQVGNNGEDLLDETDIGLGTTAPTGQLPNNSC